VIFTHDDMYYQTSMYNYYLWMRSIQNKTLRQIWRLHFPFISINIPAAPAQEVYIS